MSRPEHQGGRDAFDALFGTTSGRRTDPEEEPTQEVFVGGAGTSGASDEALPEGWWSGESSDPQGPATSSTWTTGYGAGPQLVRPARRISPVGLVALLLGGVLLGAAGVVGAMNLFSGGGSEPTVAPTTVTRTSPDTSNAPSPSSTGSEQSDEETSSEESTSPEETTTTEDSPESTTQETQESSETPSEEPASQEPSSPSTTSSASSSSSSPTPSSSASTATAAERSGELPQGASACGGASGGTKAGSGTALTSCPFAQAVRDAYVQAGGASSLEVRSPVTNKEYTMHCSGGSVTTCTGGNNAVVFLY